MSQLLPFQLVAADFLTDRNTALLADAPRVGKTAAAIRAADNAKAKRVLWVTTGSARLDHARAWSEFGLYVRRICVIEAGSNKLPPPDSMLPYVVIISYDLAAKRRAELLREWDVIVLDEVHKLKSRTSARTRAFFGLNCSGNRDGIAGWGEQVWCLSGTPAPNNYSELWPMLRALFPNTIKSVKSGKPMGYWDFANRYCRIEDNGFGLQIKGNRNAGDLKARLEGHTLRRTLDDVASEMPKLRTDVLSIGTAADLKRLRDAETNSELEKLAGLLDGLAPDAAAQVVAAVMARMDRAKLRLTGLAKVDPVLRWLADEEHEKLVMFCWHTDVIGGLASALGDGAVVLDGSTPAGRRQAVVDRFREDPGCRYFIGQIKAAGEGINLSVADELLFVESSWTPGDNEQAAMRIVNVTKRRPTLARFATIPGSVDERVQKVASAKLADLKRLFS